MKNYFKTAFNPKRNGFWYDIFVVSGFFTCFYIGFIQ